MGANKIEFEKTINSRVLRKSLLRKKHRVMRWVGQEGDDQ